MKSEISKENEIVIINHKIAEAIKILSNEKTDKFYCLNLPTGGSPTLLAGCWIYPVGTAVPLNSGHLPTDQLNYADLQAAYNRYNQCVEIGTQIASTIVAAKIKTIVDLLNNF
jgi:hypothetical protein